MRGGKNDPDPNQNSIAREGGVKRSLSTIFPLTSRNSLIKYGQNVTHNRRRPIITYLLVRYSRVSCINILRYSPNITSFNENKIIQKDSTPIKSERHSLDIDQIFVCPICKSEGIFRNLYKAQQHIAEFHQILFGVVPQIRTTEIRTLF